MKGWGQLRLKKEGLLDEQENIDSQFLAPRTELTTRERPCLWTACI